MRLERVRRAHVRDAVQQLGDVAARSWRTTCAVDERGAGEVGRHQQVDPHRLQCGIRVRELRGRPEGERAVSRSAPKQRTSTSISLCELAGEVLDVHAGAAVDLGRVLARQQDRLSRARILRTPGTVDVVPNRLCLRGDARHGAGGARHLSEVSSAAMRCVDANDATYLTTVNVAEDDLASAAALRAEPWAGEPFLRPDEDPARGRSRPGPARRRALDDGTRRDRRRPGRAVVALEGALRPDARARAGAQRAAGAHSPPAPSCAVTRSTRSPAC